MHRYRWLVLFLVSLASRHAVSSGADRPATTQWLAAPSEAARITRVETRIAPVELKGESPVNLNLQQWMETFAIPGLSVAVFDHGQIVWAKSYGVKLAGSPELVTLRTLFQAGSISKPVAAMAVLRQVEAGTLDLDQNVNEKLLSWRLPENDFTKDKKVTLRRLLSHSAGTTVHGFPGYAVDEPRPTVVQILNGEKPSNTPPVRVELVPGTKFQYSGGGVTIVQLLMTDQLKKPFPKIMKESVIGPLGLKDSTYEQPLPESRMAMAATGHRADGKPVAGKWHVYPEMAAAGLWTTASDLARVAIEVSKSKAGASNRILSKEMTRQMLTVQAGSVGLGFFLEDRTDQFGHSGSDEGFQALLVAFAGTGSGIVVMANSDNGFMLLDRLAASAAREYGWTSFKSAPDSIFVKLGLLEKLKGADKALAWYRARRAEGPEKDFNPGDLNGMGYRLLFAGRVAEAVNVFEANVELNPQDWNAYDSLGEGYMKAGKRDAAISSYKKSIQMNPKNDNGRRHLETLGVSTNPEVRTP